MARYHPEDELLFGYATGSLPEPQSLLIATHLALCPECREKVRHFEAVGGAMIEEQGDSSLQSGLRDRVLAQLDVTPVESAEPEVPVRADEFDDRVPQPLRDYLGGGLDGLDWKPRGPVDEFTIPFGQSDVSARILRIKAGRTMPSHTHDGTELTLVLSGGFTDRGLHYGRGDVDVANSSVDHAPVADEGEDCFCLAVCDGRLRLTGALTRFLNPFVRL